MKIVLNYPEHKNVCQLWDFFLGTPERVQNSGGKRAISVRATEVLQHFQISLAGIFWYMTRFTSMFWQII